MDIKEELIELTTIQIALDDKIHRIMSDFQKIRKIHSSLDKRLNNLKERHGKNN